MFSAPERSNATPQWQRTGTWCPPRTLWCGRWLDHSLPVYGLADGTHHGVPMHPVQHLRDPFRSGHGRSSAALASRRRTTERAGDGLLPAHRSLIGCAASPRRISDPPASASVAPATSLWCSACRTSSASCYVLGLTYQHGCRADTLTMPGCFSESKGMLLQCSGQQGSTEGP